MPKLSIAVLAAIAGLAIAQPAAAQDSSAIDQSATAPDPARLAAAKIAVDHVFPSGTYARMMMSGSFKEMVDQIADSVTDIPLATIGQSFGLQPADLKKLDKSTTADVMQIVDPAYKQRMDAVMDAMLPVMTDMLSGMEPGIREGLVKAYARHFTLEQLDDMNRFFATPSGAAYASDAFLLFMDPEVIARETKDMPVILQKFIAQMPQVAKEAEAATANLPKARTYKDLTPAEKARLAKLLGVDVKQLEKNHALTKASSTD